MSIFKKLFGKPTKESTQETDSENKIDSESKLDGSIGEIILKFQHSIQKPIEWNELKNVEFAMWLPCEEDKLFASSPMLEKWIVLYSLTKHYWSFITADILKTLKVVDENNMRVSLPDNFMAFAFLTTDDEQVILSLSKEKGIRLHFAETTPLKYRLLFMNNFILYCNAWKGMVDLNNGKKDEDIGFEKWWTLMVETTIGVEAIEPVLFVGSIAK